MDEAYLDLIRQFMVALAPIMTRHRLAMLRHSAKSLDEDVNRLMREAAYANASQTLEWSMHLAARFRACYNEAISPQEPEQKTK